MSELRLSIDGTERERALLASARDDGPEVFAKQRLLVGLGVATGLALASSAEAAAALGSASVTTAGGLGAAASANTALGAGLAEVAGAPAAASLAGVAKASLVTFPVLAKWVGIGAVAGLVSSSALHQVSRAVEPAPVQIQAAAPAATPAPPSVRAAQLGAPASAVNQDSASPVPEPTNGSSAPPASASVTDEVALLDEARAAVSRGDGRGALTSLARHRARFGERGALGPEAELLRIEAMLASGERHAAAQRARVFLARHAASPHAARVRTLLTRAGTHEGAPGGAAAPRPAAPLVEAAPVEPAPTSPRAAGMASFPEVD